MMEKYCAYFLITISLSLSNILHSQNFWEQTNGPYGGNISVLNINDGGDIFAGTLWRGIFRTADNGENWEEVNTGLTTLNIHDFAFSPTGHIFAATDNGVFLSTDNGNNWIQAGLDGVYVFAVAVGGNGRVLAGCNGPNNAGISIFRSDDNGATWNHSSSGLPSLGALDFAFQPGGDMYVATSYGVYKSADNGNNWNVTSLNFGWIPATAINSQGHIFVLTGNGISRSTDNGQTWIEVNNGLTVTLFSSLAINSSDHIFAGAKYWGGIFRSLDNGNSWVEINNGLTYDVAYTLCINGSDNVFAGTPGGVFRSVNNGDNWYLKSTGILNTYIDSFIMNDQDMIFTGTTTTGIFVSTDHGENWQQTGLEGETVEALAIADSGHILAGTNGLYRSTDDGQNWMKVTAYPSDLPIHTIAIHPDSLILVGAAYGLYRSQDNGNSWTPAGFQNEDVHTISISDSGHIFAGTVYIMHDPILPGIYRSKDGGNTWLKVGLDQINVYSTLITFAGDIFAGTSNGLYRSLDNGDTWEHLINGLPISRVSSITMNSQGVIFIGLPGAGVFYSTNGGATWTSINSGLCTLQVQSIFTTIDDRIFLGTDGFGIFRNVGITHLADMSRNQIEDTYHLYPNYPNPFNPTTTISWQLAVGSHVELAIYNLLGQKIKTLVNARHPAGSHQVKWDGSDDEGREVASGIYIYQLKTEKFVQNRKMVLIR